VVVRFLAAAVTKACGKHDQDERKPVRVSGKGDQDEDEREAKGREDAVDQAQERCSVNRRKGVRADCQHDRPVSKPAEVDP
jgi:hypothetical protein